MKSLINKLPTKYKAVSSLLIFLFVVAVGIGVAVYAEEMEALLFIHLILLVSPVWQT